MARRASQALAGFFPTPSHLLPAIAAIVRPLAWRQPKVTKANYYRLEHLRLLDPCAGEGAALGALVHGIGRDRHGDVSAYGCEMEQTRYAALRDRFWRHSLHGDFFQVRASPGFADLVFANPPYDTDRQYRRLEARWLDRVYPLLAHGGVLVFVVPHYALSACATILGQRFSDLRGYRFPDGDFEVFKQIVVFARRAALAVPDPAVVAWCERVAVDASVLPPLPVIPPYPDRLIGEDDPEARILAEAVLDPYPAPVDIYQGLPEWEMTRFDTGAVAALSPWATERGPMADLAHPTDLLSRTSATYPTAQPPRPIHLASALAAGVFNGLRVEPNDPSAGLPPLLVKGTFTRVWKTIDERRDEDGELKVETQTERPDLTVWVLDLRRGTYHEILSSTVQTAGLRSIAGATFADLLHHYSRSLLSALRAACPVLHDPQRDPEPTADLSGRPLWRAQNTVMHATRKVLEAHGGAIIVGEVGTGKTGIACTLARVRGHRRTLIQAPPHLLTSWHNQIAAVTPGVDVVTLDSVSDVEALRAHPGPVFALMSREAGKLGHGWRDVPSRSCPRCGTTITGERLAERRAVCGAEVRKPAGLISRWLHRHLRLLLRHRPEHPALVSEMPHTPGLIRWQAWAARNKVDLTGHVALAFLELADLIGTHPEHRSALAHRIAWSFPAIARLILTAIPAWTKDLPESLFRDRQAVMLAISPDLPLTLEEHPDETNWRRVSRSAAWAGFDDIRRWAHGLWPDRNNGPSGAYAWRSSKKGEGYGFEAGALWGCKPGSKNSLDLLLHEVVTLAREEGRHAVCTEPLYQGTPAPRRYPLGAYVTRRAKDLFDMLIFDESHELASDTSAQGIMFMRLAQMAHRTGADVLCLTGSVANGYAESLFNALWATSPTFRAAFKWTDRETFIDRYGLRKRVVVHDRKGVEIQVTRGATSERIMGKVKPAGCTPGVLPTLLLDHLLRVSSIIHKADLDIFLPTMTETCPVLPMPEQVRANLDHLLAEVKRAIGATRYIKGLSGMLFGALTGLLSYPDLAAVGTEPDGSYVLRWPENTPEVVADRWPKPIGPGLEITSAPALPVGLDLPKERLMVEQVRESLDSGRGALLLPVHRVLLARYADLLRAAGLDSLVLDAQKVEARKREPWIDRHLNTRTRRVLIANPTCIQTGLNNLVTLQDSIWMENPGCNPIIDEQANGRVHRPNQTQPVQIIRPVYDHPLTLTGFRLLMHKVGVVRSVGGLSPEAVYAAAGIGDEATAGLSVGAELYRMLSQEAERA